jgi:hypothetical protein
MATVPSSPDVPPGWGNILGGVSAAGPTRSHGIHSGWELGSRIRLRLKPWRESYIRNS